MNPQPVVAPEAHKVRVVRTEPAFRSPGQYTIKALARAQVAVARAERAHRGWTIGRQLLGRAQAYAWQGLELRGREYARQATELANAEAAEYYRRGAIDYWQTARQFARLSDAQYGQLRRVEALMARGQYIQAHDILEPLVRHFFTASTTYVSRRGDSLLSIAARRDVYDNSRLWPILLRDNKALLAAPEQLRAGMRLRIRTHPRLEDVFEAAIYAGERARSGAAARDRLDRDFLSRSAR